MKRHLLLVATLFLTITIMLGLFTSLVPGVGAVSVTVPYSPTAVAVSDLDGNPSTGSWSDASVYLVPLENGEADPYGTVTMYVKHDGTNLYVRIDGKIDVAWTSATGDHFWLGFLVSPPSTTGHHRAGQDLVFFGETSYPGVTYPLTPIDAFGSSKPPTKDIQQDAVGTALYSGAVAPFSFTAEWKKALNTGDSQDIVLSADGSSLYNFYVTTDSGGGGSSGGSIDHSVITNANTMKLQAPSPANTAPTLNVPNPQTVNELTPLVFTVSATDPDPGDTLTLSATGLPAGASFPTVTNTGGSISGTFSWTPTETQDGSYTLTFSVSDSVNPTVSLAVSVTVNEVNVAPTLNLPSPQTINQGSTLSFTVSASDPDVIAGIPQPITLSATSMPSGATCTPNPSTGPGSASITCNWTPTSSGAFTFSFSVTDNVAALVTGDVTVNVVQNQPPVLTVAGVQTVDEQVLLTFTVSATDQDADTLTLSCTNCDALGATFASSPGPSPVSGTFSWTPTEAQGPGTYTVTFTVNDGINAPVSQTVSITVNEVNMAPSVSAPASQTASVGIVLTFTVTATDLDLPPNTMTLSASGLAGNMAFPTLTGTSPLSGTFTFTPDASQTGMTFTVTFSANDGVGGTGTTQTMITVPSIQDPVFVRGKLSWTHHLSLSKNSNMQAWTAKVFNPNQAIDLYINIHIEGVGDTGVPFTADSGPILLTAGSTNLNVAISHTFDTSAQGFKFTFSATIRWGLSPDSMTFTSPSIKSGSFAVVA